MRRGYLYICFYFLLFLLSCRPEAPVTSVITIDMEKPVMPVNEALYGLSLEEINHAIDGGLYAELIRNRSFEEGVVPEGCRYNSATHCLETPTGWTIPFIPPDSLPGWRVCTDHTMMFHDTKELINKDNHRSLWVRVGHWGGEGGIAAEGFNGIPVRKNESYRLSFFIRGRRYTSVRVGLRDSSATRRLSDTLLVYPSHEWMQVKHTFTATEDNPHATLVFKADTGTWFNLDVVSLFPPTWKERPNGLRPDLAEALAALHPKFIRFPGGAFAEGYSFDMIPKWDETVGPIATRKPMWSIWGYGTTNGMGFHEYLQLCEDMKVNPIYVVNSGVLNQRYGSVYVELGNMTLGAQRLQQALGYANYVPWDSAQVRQRTANGHLSPFGLQTVELGNANFGSRYARRYQYLHEAVKSAFPQVQLIGTDTLATMPWHEDWIDSHFIANENFLTGNYNCFDEENITIRTPMRFVGEFGAACSAAGGTLQAAVGEAAFLIGVERNPMNVKGIAYSPVLGRLDYPAHGAAAIQFDGTHLVKTPSYYMMEMFAKNRGDQVVVTNVQTYRKNLVTGGRSSVVTEGHAYEVGDMMLNGRPAPFDTLRRERVFAKPVLPRWYPSVPSAPEENRVRYVVRGDSMMYNCVFSVKIKPVQVNGNELQVRIRDNRLEGEQSDFVALKITDGKTAALYHCAGSAERRLSAPVPVALENGQWYTFRLVAEDERIECFLNDNPLVSAVTLTIPSILAVATLEQATNTLILKVVNATFHEEWTSFRLAGKSMEYEAEVIQLAGRPESRNTLTSPEAIVPVYSTHRFSVQPPAKYVFPPQSITIMRLKVK